MRNLAQVRFLHARESAQNHSCVDTTQISQVSAREGHVACCPNWLHLSLQVLALQTLGITHRHLPDMGRGTILFLRISINPVDGFRLTVCACAGS